MTTFESTLPFPLPPRPALRLATESLAGRNRVAVRWRPAARRQRT